VDSLQHKYAKLIEGLTFNTKAKHPYFQAISYSKELENDTLTKQLKQAKEKRAQKENQRTPEKTVADSLTLAPVYSFSKMSKENRSATFDYLKSQLRKNIKSLEGQINIEKNRHKALRRYEIEFHRKFALSFAIILLFFIGAPLGAIVKRGGFGAPVVIAALLFMIYFVLITIGDGIAESHVVSPFLGMWGPNFILMPIAMLLMYSAANDKSLSFNLFSKIKNRLKRKKNE
jgi:lipopolysaccharide export system permease protein